MLDHQLSRRSFNAAWAYALLGSATITILGCSGDDATPAAPRSPESGDAVGVISENHGHAAVITAAQLMAGGALALGIRGSSPHDHGVSLSASEVASVRAGARVSKESTTDDGHSHMVTFN